MSTKMYMKLSSGFRPSKDKNFYGNIVFDSTVFLIKKHLKDGVSPKVV